MAGFPLSAAIKAMILGPTWPQGDRILGSRPFSNWIDHCALFIAKVFPLGLRA